MITFIRRFWFPIALIALLILALPSLILYALNLFGLQSPINSWLENEFNLSYHIPIPWWGGLILLLIPVAVLLLYFLKLKRRPIHVPSTFLWRKSIEDLHVNSLLQWLRQNVLLLLQLLTLLVLIYAILAVRFYGRGGEGRRYILLIDNSASMATADVAPSRLEWAKQEAIKEVDAAGEHDVGMVIEFNSSAITRQSFTSDRDLLRQAIRSIEPTQRTTQIKDALELASSLANPTRSTEDVAVQPVGVEPGQERTFVPVESEKTSVHLYSDGRFKDVADFHLGNLRMTFHRAGKSEGVDNVALVGLSARRDDNNPNLMRIFARVINFRDQATKARVRLTVQKGNDRSIYEEPVEMDARLVAKEGEGENAVVIDLPGEDSASFDLEDLDDVVLHAQLLDVKDAFPLDDEAWLVLGLIRKARVLIVGPPNAVLSKFFEGNQAVKEVADVERLTEADLATDAYLEPARNGDFDLVLFDRCAPKDADAMPRSNTFFIGRLPPGAKQPTTMTKNPFVRGWMYRHPVLRYLVALQNLGISEAILVHRKDLPQRTPILMEGDRETALLYARQRQAFTDLVMTFPILNDDNKWNTDWPLQASFPLFLNNVLHTLGHIRDSVEEENLQPGQMKVIRPDLAVDTITVYNPEGGRQKLERGTRPTFFYGSTDRVGIYHATWEHAIRRFAVNLLDSQESHLEPRQVINLGQERIKAGEERGTPRELWPWIILAALALIMLEWYIYNRRVYI